MKWDWIFFDANETLFTFDSFTSLQQMFLDYSVTFTTEDFQDYQAINKPLWVDYQNSTITSLQLQHRQFESWAKQLNIKPGKLNKAFINAMAEICTPLPGTVSLLNTIHGNAKISIITNSFSALQQVHLEHTGLHDYFNLLVISKEVGVAKPNKKIFNYALEQAGNPDHSHVLMVGNTAKSNILSGINTRLATCWLNAHHHKQPEGITPTWTISSLHKLEQLLCKH